MACRSPSSGTEASDQGNTKDKEERRGAASVGVCRSQRHERYLDSGVPKCPDESHASVPRPNCEERDECTEAWQKETFVPKGKSSGTETGKTTRKTRFCRSVMPRPKLRYRSHFCEEKHVSAESAGQTYASVPRPCSDAQENTNTALGFLIWIFVMYHLDLVL